MQRLFVGNTNEVVVYLALTIERAKKVGWKDSTKSESDKHQVTSSIFRVPLAESFLANLGRHLRLISDRWVTWCFSPNRRLRVIVRAGASDTVTSQRRACLGNLFGFPASLGQL